LNRKYGSRDRKWISHLCYCFFRLGKAGRKIPQQERIIAGLLLCSQSPNELLAALRPGWEHAIPMDIDKKLSFLDKQGLGIHLDEIFPPVKMSGGISTNELSRAQFIQPDLFIRVRPGFKENVFSRLEEAGMAYRFIEPYAVALHNSVKLQGLLEMDREVVVQDLSSQKTWDFIPERRTINDVWDCCAASGGKSFLIKDKLGDVSLTVSDIRSSILANLEKRFRAGGLGNYEVKPLDLRYPENIPRNAFDLVVADAPCTGSGTWSRTPEQLYFFNEGTVKDFHHLQTTITTNLVPAIRSGGHLLYITCSVFYEENELVTEKLAKEGNLKILRQDIIRGYNEKADTMFACLLQKN
jgi:16S rRNA (cytosine967-C5)-methyltransferase